MASTAIHEEIKNWNNLTNLIDLMKYQYSNLFPHVYWGAGLILFALGIYVIYGKDIIIKILGTELWAVLAFILLLAFIWTISKISQSHKQANENMDYLYRKKDGQKV